MSQLVAIPGGGPILRPMAPGAVRRTMTLTVAPMSDSWVDGRVVRLKGRDAVASASGAVLSEQEAQWGFGLDEAGGIVALAGVSAVPDQLVGVNAQHGLRKVLAGFREVVSPDLGPSGGLRIELLDDLPGFLVASGYGRLFDGTVSEGPGGGINAGLGGVCFGFHQLATTGERWSVQRFQSQAVSEEFTDGDPGVWHDDEPSPPVSVRRRRMLEVSPDQDGVEIEGYFRDVYCGADGSQTTIHEYGLHARVAGDPLVVEAITARPGLLPMEFCPQVVGNVAGLQGVTLEQLESSVRQVLRGPAGCTHLNDEIRSLRMVTALLACLEE